MADPNSSFGELASTTIANYSSTMADNVTNHVPLLFYLKKKGLDKKNSVDGGTQILENLSYAENGTFKWFTGYEALSVSPTDSFTSANFTWKEANANVVFNGREEAINQGKNRKHAFIKGKVENTERTFINNFGAALFYSNTENSGLSVGGLQHLVADDPTTGTVGGINRATAGNAFWRNQLWDFSTEGLTSGTSSILQATRTLHRRCLRNGDSPDLAVFGDTYWGYFEAALEAKQRFAEQDEVDAGFSFVKYKGMKCIYDGNCADERFYILNLDHMKWRPHSAVNMKTGKAKYPTNQNATIIPIVWMGNMTISNASLCGVGIE